MAIHKNTRQKVYDKYDGHCAYCGICLTPKKMQIDHIVPKIFKGSDDFENLNPSCKHCNNYKCHSSLEEFRAFAKQMFNEKLHYLFKSKTKMQIAINFGVIKLAEWDGVFHFEAVEKIKLKLFK